MTINSISFILFFFVVASLYYLLSKKSLLLQNLFLLICSYYFYAQINPKMCFLLALMTFIFWLLGKSISKHVEQAPKKAYKYTLISAIIGVCTLVYFKYLNFFIDSIISLCDQVGWHMSFTTINIVVPVGVSFFTFKLISYTVDIYNEKIKDEPSLLIFANYIAFFPTILSGPIDRPKPFLKQLNSRKEFDYNLFFLGFKRVFWGMLLKMCVADRLDIYLQAIFNNYPHHSSITIVFAILLYPIQLYADFCGYSDMAIGVGNILGFKITENFKRPFFATNVSEFWRRWHISLTSWLTDYVFIPLNIMLRDYGKLGSILAISINFILVGMWHGANWTYFVFGIYYALLFIPMMTGGNFFKKEKIATNKYGLPVKNVVIKMSLTYLLVSISFLLFRSNTIDQAFDIISTIFSNNSFSIFTDSLTLTNACICFIILAYKDIQDEYFKNSKFPLPKALDPWRNSITLVFYSLIILLFGVFDNTQFIYFQF